MAMLLVLNQMCKAQLTMSTLFNLLPVPLLLLLVFVLFSLHRSGEKLKSPPSPTRLPLIGNPHQLGTLPHRSLHALSNKYGPLMLLQLGQVPTLVASSADMTKQIMKNYDADFSGRPKSTAAHILLYDSQDIAYAPYGEYWRQVRKICVLELLSLKRVQQFQYAREEEVAELVESIRKASLSESMINLSDFLIKTSINIISRCIIGKRFVGDDNWFGEISRRLMMQLATSSTGDFFPYFGWIDNLGGFIARLKATSAKLDGFFAQLIEEHKTTEGSHSKTSNFVDILVKLQKDDMLNLKLTQDNLKAIIQDMFIGGSDTTSTTLEWLIAELVRNPSVMEKLQHEERNAVGQKAEVDENDINQMHYLKCVVKETLRLHPPAPLLVPRETTSAVTLGGDHIPAKTRVVVNAFMIHRDPKLWDRPEEFILERFANGTIDFRGDDFQFIPYGGGRRGCPGQNFGVAAVEYVLANLLYWFDWNLPNDNLSTEALDMKEVFGITVHKKAHLYLVPTPYSP